MNDKTIEFDVGSGNVYVDLDFPDADEMLVKAQLAAKIGEIIKALNAHARFLRGILGKHIDMKFTPDLKFRHDDSFDAAGHMERLFNDPRVRADIEHIDDEQD